MMEKLSTVVFNDVKRGIIIYNLKGVAKRHRIWWNVKESLYNWYELYLRWIIYGAIIILFNTNSIRSVSTWHGTGRDFLDCVKEDIHVGRVNIHFWESWNQFSRDVGETLLPNSDEIRFEKSSARFLRIFPPSLYAFHQDLYNSFHNYSSIVQFI